MKRLKTILHTTLLLSSLLPVQALDYRSHLLSHADGLNSNFVRAMVQDSTGFVWFGTLNGLCRYDGYTMKEVAGRQTVNEGIIPDNRMVNIYLWGNRFLWCKLRGNLFVCYDLQENRFVDYTGRGETPIVFRTGYFDNPEEAWLLDRTNGCRRVTFDGKRFASQDFTTQNRQLPSDYVNFIRQGLHGRTWIATTKGLVLYERQRTRTLSHDDVSSMVILDGKEYFVTSQGGISLYANGRLSVLVKGSPSFPVVTGAVARPAIHQMVIATKGDTYEYGIKDRRLQKSTAITAKGCTVVSDNRGNHLLSNNRGQITWMDGKGTTYRTMSLFGTADRVLPDLRLQAVTTQGGEVWMSTYGEGLFVYSLHTGQLTAVREGRNTDALIQTNYLRGLMEDCNGNVWISQENLGVTCAHPLDAGCQYVALSTPERNGGWDFQHNTVQTLRCDTDGSVYLVNPAGLLMTLNADLTVAPTKDENIAGTLTKRVQADNHRYIGTRDNGLYIDGRPYVHQDDDSLSLSSNRISDFICDAKGRLWIAAFGGGLDMAEADGKGGYRFRHFFHGSREERDSRTVITDHHGRIWLGNGEGVRVFRPDSLLMDSRHFLLLKTNGNAKMDEVHDIFEDSRHRVWVCLSGSGVTLYDNAGASPRLIGHITTDDGLGSDMPQVVVEDRHGRIWIGTHHGVSQYDETSGKMLNHIYVNSPWSNICMERAACRMTDGRLVFGTKHGLLVISPDISSPKRKPLIAITDLLVNGISVDSRLQDVSLSHSENSLTFHFTDFAYDADKTSRYTYRLEGYDKEWAAPSTLSFATYKNLPPGQYTFVLRDYDRPEAEVSLTVTIRPPFWLSWWAYLIYIILAAAIVYQLYHHFKRINELHNRIKVEQQLAEYKLQFFTNISHEFRTPLTIIQGAMERIREAGNIPGNLKQPVGNMQKSVKRMSRLITRLMDFRKLQEDKMELAVEETEVIGFVRDIWSTFRDMADNKHINLQFATFASTYKVPVDRRKLESIAYNLMSNALKYTPAGGSVTVRMGKDDAGQQLLMEVTDTGVGISKERQQDLFGRFNQSGSSNDSIGIGLYLSYQMAVIHKGSLKYRENPEGGSIFTLTLPATAEAYTEADYAKEMDTTIVEDKQHDKWFEDYREVAPPSMNDRKLLIVEDDDDVRNFLTTELRSYFDISEACNGQEAWRLISEQRPDIILSDVAMPLMNGFELTKRIKKDASLADIPVVLLTALTDDMKRERGFQVGADGYIQKPFSMRTLMARLSQLLEQRDKLRNSYSNVEAAPVVAVIKDERDKKFLMQLDNWIYGHMADTTMNVDELALTMGFGRSSFYRKVNTLTGMTPNNYIRRIRMEKSKELLEETNLTISEVAYKTGFNSAFYFSKIFKDYYGMAPSYFRNGPKER